MYRKKGLGLLWASKRNGRVRHTRLDCSLLGAM